MTVSQIHDHMTAKVIPESVMPQNIAACLMDEDMSIPELDAFTFLNRVRALGIGSADFLYLLKGCDAPQEAVDKIENNPAMNLNSLIVTLENSGLTSQDYTRMLYTARQIWERTLTMRLEKKQLEQPEEDYDLDDLPDPDEQDEEIPEKYTDRAAEAILTARQKPAAQPEVLTARQLPKKSEDAEVLTGRQHSDEHEDDADESREILTARQKPKKEYIGRDDYDEFYDEDRPVARHNGKIAASAVGAAVLIGLCAAMDVFGLETLTEKPQVSGYAEDNMAVFSRIHSAYTSGKVGGDNVFSYTRNGSEVFGTLLVETPSELGVFTMGERAFSAESDVITAYEVTGDTVTEVFAIVPPEETEFIDVIENGELLTVVYADSDSAGIAAYDKDGKMVYTAEQCGVLTDVYIGSDTVSLGTVYTPEFRQSFKVEQTEYYLPQFTLDGAANEMLPTEIILSDTEGCSYAVYGCFSLADGTVKERGAVLGDPVFSGAEDFFAAMRSENGCVLIGKGDDGAASVKEAGNIIACNVGDTFVMQLSEDAEPFDSTPDIKRQQVVAATAEKDENGTTVYLRGFDFEPVSALANIQGEVTKLDMHGGVLYIIGTDGVIMAVDVSDPSAPAVMELTSVQGVVDENSALCSSISGTLVKLTLYKKDESGAVAEAGSASKVVTVADGSSVSMCGGNTYFIGEDRYGAAYSYFDGVSMISEYTVFGRTKASHSLFDEDEGFSFAAELDGALRLVYGNEHIRIN